MQSRTFDASMLGDLLRSSEQPCVTLTLPTDEVGRDVQQIALRYRHLLAQAEAMLETSRNASPEAQATPSKVLGELVGALRQAVDDDAFWAGQDKGLAIYAKPGWMLMVRLPYAPAEQVQVGDHFMLRPVVPLFGRPSQCYVVALSINRAQVIEVGPAGGRELAIEGMPESMAAALGDTQYYSGTSVHSGGPASLGHRGGIVHGHGDDDEERHDESLLAYFRQVYGALEGKLPASVPWQLAAVEEYHSIFRKASRDDARLQPELIKGNPDHLDPQQLAARARENMEQQGATELAGWLRRFEREAGSSKVAVELSTITQAAVQGRVASLLVSPDFEYWGRLDDETGELSVHQEQQPGDVELVDLSIFRTLQNGGDVLQVAKSQLPIGDEMAALLRY
jgi:hypothetical protein